MARFEITSFVFMFDWVPDPVCHTTSGKWSSWSPRMTSSAACSRALLSPSESIESSPSSRFAHAAAFFVIPSARIISRGNVCPPILKFWRERWVWAPHRASVGTSIGPKESDSVRVLMESSGGSLRGWLRGGPGRAGCRGRLGSRRRSSASRCARRCRAAARRSPRRRACRGLRARPCRGLRCRTDR